jgi:tetratricopeptide (TPR) repeat protein
MCAGRPDDRDEEPRHAQHSEVSGSASDVVQARDVHGGVHFHGPDDLHDPIPRQLPGDVSGFVNRLNELAQLDQALTDEREEPLVVGLYLITGTAGVGKTSLALHWAHSVRGRFPDGQLYVNLRGYDPGPRVSPEQVLDRFLRALGVRPAGIPADIEDRAALYRSLLADRRTLVILDNAATVHQVRPLLPGNAECLVLVTSRSRLAGLVARDGARRLSLDVLTEEEAAELLRSVTAGYRGPDELADIAELATLCARLPLALRIAAERASNRPLMHLDELIADLRDESALWDALTADDGEEADAVRSVFAWSYRALPESAARLFRLLGLHPGPEFGIPAAAALSRSSRLQARHLLDVLVGAHVLEQHAPGRYQFHDLLRVYANDQAIEHETPEERASALRRLVSWYLHSANAAATVVAPLNRQIRLDPPEPDVHPASFADEGQAFRWYEEERANLVSVTRTAAKAGLHSAAWQLPAVLRTIYARQNPFEDWLTTGRIGLDSVRRLGDRQGESELLESLGMACLQSQRLDDAEQCHNAALEIRQETGDHLGAGISVNALGLLAWRRHRLETARIRFEMAFETFRDLAERRWEALVLANLGMTYHDLDRPGEAADTLHSAVTICQELGDRHYEGNALHFLAMAQRELGQMDEALASIQAALEIAHDQGNLVVEGFWLLELARVRRAMGEPDDALTSCQRAASIQRRLGDRSREALALDGTGEAYSELGVPEEAAKFHRLAAATHRELGDRWQLAIALANLAAAMRETGSPASARSYWSEAATILAEFDDPRAARLRIRIDDSLAATE